MYYMILLAYNKQLRIKHTHLKDGFMTTIMVTQHLTVRTRNAHLLAHVKYQFSENEKIAILQSMSRYAPQIYSHLVAANSEITHVRSFLGVVVEHSLNASSFHSAGRNRTPAENKQRMRLSNLCCVCDQSHISLHRAKVDICYRRRV